MQKLPVTEINTIAQQLRNRGLKLLENFQNDGGWVFIFNSEEEAVEASKIVLERNDKPRLGLLALNQILDGEKSGSEPASGSASNTHKHYFLPNGFDDDPNDFNSAVHNRLSEVQNEQNAAPK